MDIHKENGFTLIEIMVVIGVLLIIITLALPNIIRSRIIANESAAFANLKMIFNACQNYYSGVSPHEFPEKLINLAEPYSHPPYIDSVLASGEKQGYEFVYQRLTEESFTLRANPKSALNGRKYFFVNENGSFRYSLEGPADEDSPEFKI